MPKKKINRKYGYKFSYFDPADPEGIKDKTWRFRTKQQALAERRDIANFWGDHPNAIKVVRYKKKKRR